jgi:hypothetical protein
VSQDISVNANQALEHNNQAILSVKHEASTLGEAGSFSNYEVQ